ncbi:MAG: SDR family oxidoreductase [Actinobacteria bacterium]|nr:SDR family oxidoreductase [Actinomycetota bacterium]
MDLGLDGSACVITGGTSGIGEAVARLLVAEGGRVMIVGRAEERLEAARGRLAGDEGAVALLAADVTAEDAPARVRDAALAAFGRIDGLVNAAGVSATTSLDAGPLEPWHEQWELNVIAPKRLIDALAPAMIEAGGGTIVNVASSAGRRPSATDAAYAVAKRGELALTEVYAQELAPRGVRVVAVAPGPTATPLWMDPGGRLDELTAAAGEPRDEVLAAVATKLPLGRLATSEEVAAAVLAALAGLAGDGAVLPVDGGHVTETYP